MLLVIDFISCMEAMCPYMQKASINNATAMSTQKKRCNIPVKEKNIPYMMYTTWSCIIKCLFYCIST